MLNANPSCAWCRGTGYRKAIDTDEGTSSDQCSCVRAAEPDAIDPVLDGERVDRAVSALHGELSRMRRPGARYEAEAIGRAFRLHTRARRDPVRVVEAITKVDRVEASRLARAFLEAGRWAA